MKLLVASDLMLPVLRSEFVLLDDFFQLPVLCNGIYCNKSIFYALCV